ncbi:MAG: hypothetical protein DMG65_18060 [Candidatus Angelobacter sp. Gp1-AA117]|nr:MAG: hypothetical protein DMG65_18060 [Candidatus Angelobacter sp. Gp1-AA117]
MKRVLQLLLLTLLLSLTAFSCDDPYLRRGLIGEWDIRGAALQEPGKGLAFAEVQLYSGKTHLRTTITNSNGSFDFGPITPGEYRLSIANWGSFDVEVEAFSRIGGGQYAYYSVLLLPDNCIAAGFSTN